MDVTVLLPSVVVVVAVGVVVVLAMLPAVKRAKTRGWECIHVGRLGYIHAGFDVRVGVHKATHERDLLQTRHSRYWL